MKKRVLLQCGNKREENIAYQPLIRVLVLSVLCTPPASTIATANFTRYNPKIWGHKLAKISFLPAKYEKSNRLIYFDLFLWHMYNPTYVSIYYAVLGLNWKMISKVSFDLIFSDLANFLNIHIIFKATMLLFPSTTVFHFSQSRQYCKSGMSHSSTNHA